MLKKTLEIVYLRENLSYLGKKRMFGKKNTTNTREIGNQKEELATAFLEEHGFSIVERNYYASKLGEIDIIANKEGVLHFIEVKSASKDFEPLYNLTPSKLKKLINSAHYYLKQKRLDLPWCVDALIVRGNEIELLENITL